MCRECINNLQTSLDAAALKDPPEFVLIHFESSGESITRPGVSVSPAEMEAKLHASMDPNCWCCPIVILPGDVRTSEEIWAQVSCAERIT